MFTLEFKFKRAQGRDLFYFIFLKKGQTENLLFGFYDRFCACRFLSTTVLKEWKMHQQCGWHVSVKDKSEISCKNTQHKLWDSQNDRQIKSTKLKQSYCELCFHCSEISYCLQIQLTLASKQALITVIDQQ